MIVPSRPEVLWITRSAPFGLSTARQYGSEGLPALAVPVLQVTPLGVRRLDGLPDAILFTSAHAVRHHPFDPAWRDVLVLTLGDETAERAMGRGYSNVRRVTGDLEDLKVLITASLPPRARLFLFGAKEAADELGAFLRRGRFEVERSLVYEIRSSTDLELRNALDLLDRIGGICVYSPKGAERVSELVGERSWKGTIFCLSKACADRIAQRSGLKVEVALLPSEQALRQLVRSCWLGQTGVRAGPGQAAGLALRQLRPADPQGSANDNAASPSRPFAGAPGQGDEEPPPPAA